MRVLVLTNHFSEFAGSEIIALEVAQWFRERGDQVALAANLVRSPMRDFADSIEVLGNVEDIDLSSFDLVWCQHNLLSLLPFAAYAKAASSPPLAALVSLSPFEPYEHMDGLLANALSAKIFANSAETADDISRRNQGVIKRDRVTVFHNAAPPAYWSVPPPRETLLRDITIVSNHAPVELMAAAESLKERGIGVRHIGLKGDYQRVEISDIDACDALITIGKTVTYGIARAKPIYVYDHFGGDGWLNSSNFAANLAHNFSGRPNISRLSADALVTELVDGYERAAREMHEIRQTHDMSRFRLDSYLEPLREQALKPRRWRAFALQRALASPKFRAHLESSRQSSLVMRRSYLLANGASLSERDHHPNLWSNRMKGGSSS